MAARAELAGKVAVVTGVTRRAGLGAAIARELVEAAESRFGPVDILINNAAHWEPGGIRQVSAEQLDRHFAVNTRAAVLLCSEFVQRRRPGVGGRIINVTSGQGQEPMPGEVAYAVTKAGLDALTLSLAADLLTLGVTVNAIDPGPIDTGWMTADVRARLTSASPTGSLARPEDLSSVVRLLCAETAAGITGRIIRIQSEGAVESLKPELAGHATTVIGDRR